MNLSPQAAALLAAELDPIDVEYDIDGVTIRLYPTVEVRTRDYVHAFSTALRSTPGAVYWEGGRPT